MELFELVSSHRSLAVICLLMSSLICPSTSTTLDVTESDDTWSGLSVTLSPDRLLRVRQGQKSLVVISVYCPGCVVHNTLQLRTFIHDVTVADVEVTSDDDNSSVVLAQQSTESRDLTDDWYTFNVSIRGKVIGKTHLSVHLLVDDLLPWQLNYTYEVHVLRAMLPLANFARVVIALSIAVNTMTFGCMAESDVIKQYVKRPFGIIIGFLCQFIIMPLVAFGIGKALSLPANMALALLAIGASPGGPPSNICTVLLKGDINLSVVMTLFSTVAAIGLTPMYMYTLGSVILRDEYPGHVIRLPWILLIICTVGFSVPYIAGLLIARFCNQKVINVMTRVVRPLAFLFTAATLIIILVLTHTVYRLADTWQIIIASLLVPYIGFAVSFLLALVARRTLRVAVTIMIETGVQNLTFTFVVLGVMLPQPDGDMAAVVPMITLFGTFGPLLVIFLAMTIRDVMTRRMSGIHKGDKKHNPDDVMRIHKEDEPQKHNPDDFILLPRTQKTLDFHKSADPVGIGKTTPDEMTNEALMAAYVLGENS